MTYAGSKLTSYKRPSEVIVLDALPAELDGKDPEASTVGSARSA